MTSDFDIRNNNWNSLFPYYSMHADCLLEIAELFNLEKISPINLVPIKYTDNSNDSNSIIDLMFFRNYFERFNTHSILLDMRGPSDHVLLIVDITIQEKFIWKRKISLYKESKEEKNFIQQLRENLGCINTLAIENSQLLEIIVEIFAWNNME